MSMGGRDHSIECERCGTPYSGFNGPDECPQCHPDKGSYPSTYTLSSGEAAKAELRELREVAEELAQALSQCADVLESAESGMLRSHVIDIEAALARYEALRDG